jgi:hypothetical protein
MVRKRTLLVGLMRRMAEKTEVGEVDGGEVRSVWNWGMRRRGVPAIPETAKDQFLSMGVQRWGRNKPWK